MVKAVFFDTDETEGIYSEAELTRSGAMKQVDWSGTPVPIAGLDPAFTNGGDRCILYTGLVGYDTTGQYVCQLKEAIHLNDDATNKAVPRTYQIVRQVKEECVKRNILAENLALDSTGAGSPFADVLSAEFGEQILRVSFGGKASDKRVSVNSKLIGQELYVNRVSELWFVGKEFIRTKQLFGISNDLAQEITGRNYDMIKGATLRMKIESKPEFKSRFGKSPDLADAAFLCLDMARQRHGFVAVEPPNDVTEGQVARPRRTIRALTNALAGDTLSGV